MLDVKNRIINYFSIQSSVSKSPVVYKCPLTIDKSVAKELLLKQFDNLKIDNGLLHVCYDCESEIVYVLNSEDFNFEILNVLLKSVRLRLNKDFPSKSSFNIVYGSPYSLIRFRSVDSFPKAKSFFPDLDLNIKILEANLSRMPLTLSQVSNKNEEFLGGYIQHSVDFLESIDKNGNILADVKNLIRMDEPFILINTCPRNNSYVKHTEKEWVVISCLRDITQKNKQTDSYIENNSDLYTLRYYLGEGWSFEEACCAFMDGVVDFENFLLRSSRLNLVLEDIISNGFFQEKRNYYISMKISENFPLDLKSIIDLSSMTIRKDLQLDFFKIIDIDISDSIIIIETPLFLSADLCKSVFNLAFEPFICHYNPKTSKVDIKNNGALSKKQAFKIIEFITNDEGLDSPIEFSYSDYSRGAWYVNPNVFNMRKISDYFNACSYIKKMSDRYSVSFNDLDVIVGPIESVMGEGSQGGFVSKVDGGKLQLDENICIIPPCILINSVTMPSYSEQAETLVHEYRHYIYGLQNPFYEKTYGDMHDKSGDMFLIEWDKYMGDENEKEAHKEEILYGLFIGKSIDEMIRDKVGGKITVENYIIALRYKDLVEDVIKNTEVKK